MMGGPTFKPLLHEAVKHVERLLAGMGCTTLPGVPTWPAPGGGVGALTGDGVPNGLAPGGGVGPSPRAAAAGVASPAPGGDAGALTGAAAASVVPTGGMPSAGPAPEAQSTAGAAGQPAAGAGGRPTKRLKAEVAGNGLAEKEEEEEERDVVAAAAEEAAGAAEGAAVAQAPVAGGTAGAASTPVAEDSLAAGGVHAATGGRPAAVPLPPGSLEKGGPGRSPVPVMDLPSLERFAAECMLVRPHGRPTIITGGMDAWPAMQRWRDLGYLRRMAGHRTVPVEVGAHYLTEGWGQSLMTLSHFIDTHILATHTPSTTATPPPAPAPAPPSTAPAATPPGAPLDTLPQTKLDPAALTAPLAAPPPTALDPALLAASLTAPLGAPPPAAPVTPAPTATRPAAPPVGYLAQHPLFDQIPALARDVMTPEYCVLGKDEEEGGGVQAVNAWFGPAGTVTPLHTDPHHNLLCQVVGVKYVRLYSPDQSQAMYPFTEGLTTNSSQVDLMAVDPNRFPSFLSASYQDCLLRPGQMLYIPPGWWHFVASLELSFSVSYWWC